MAKAISTFISIGLLVVAHRAADHWQRTHARSSTEQAQSSQMRADAASFESTPKFVPTNFASETQATIVPSQP